MSDLTPTQPELLTHRIDVAYASSIERIVTGRNAALAEIADLIRHLAAISELTASIGGGTFNDWGERASHRHGCWLMASEEFAMKMITQSMDRSIWRNLMHQSGLGALMDADSRARWYRKLALEEVCTISEENIHRTFEMWRNDKKMIQDEKTVPDNRADITRSLEDPIHENRHSNRYQTEMFAIKYLEEGTAQITNRSPELFEKMNEILISYCPSALASSS